jgi:predicted RecB family endonuclease
MVHPSARPVAEKLGIEVFAYAEDTTGLKEP